MEEKVMTPLKAIRAKCLHCCMYQANEVRLCAIMDCPLRPYRMGHNPNRKGVGRRNIDSATLTQKNASE